MQQPPYEQWQQWQPSTQYPPYQPLWQPPSQVVFMPQPTPTAKSKNETNEDIFHSQLHWLCYAHRPCYARQRGSCRERCRWHDWLRGLCAVCRFYLPLPDLMGLQRVKRLGFAPPQGAINVAATPFPYAAIFC